MDRNSVASLEFPFFSGRLAAAVFSPLRRLLGLPALESLYASIRADAKDVPLSPAEFCSTVLHRLGVSYTLPDAQIEDLRRIQGPLLFVANHPLGAIDALALILITENARPGSSFIGNSILSLIEELRPVLLPLDIRDRDRDVPGNATGLRRTYRTLAMGKAVAVFPAGRVAEFESLFSKRVTEAAWHLHIAQILRRSRATVVPISFGGDSPYFFSLLAYLVPPLRIALLARGMLHYRRELPIQIGAPLTPEAIAEYRDDAQVSSELRRLTLLLRQ